MAKVTGTLQDIGLNAMTGKRARIIFTPDQPSVRGGFVIATSEVVADVGQNGIFSAELQPSMATNPPTPLKVAIEWQDSAGNYTRTDIPQWRLVVREEGGNFGQQIAMVGPGVVSVKPDRSDIDESVNRILPTALASSPAVVEAGKIAAENALRAADLLVGSEHRSPKTGQDDAFRVRDLDGKVALGVNPDGSVALGDTGVQASEGFRIRDRDGQVAFEVTPDGRTHVYDPAFTTGGAVSGPVDTLHVFIAAGQSNMSGRGLPINTNLDRPNTRIMQYGSKVRTLRTATVPLDMHDNASGLSPASTFADEYLKMQPGNVGVLIIPAAHGATGFSSSTTALTWKPNVDSSPGQNLFDESIKQTREALAAAQAAGYSTELKGVLWHQGENDSGMALATYSANMLLLIGGYREAFGTPGLPVVVGQMSPESIAVTPGRSNIDNSHMETPARTVNTGFAPAMSGGTNPGDDTHFSRKGVLHFGKTYLAGYWQAVGNIMGSPPLPPANVKATKGGGVLSVSWDAPPRSLPASTQSFNLETGRTETDWVVPPSRITSYRVEYQVGNGPWVVVPRDWPMSLREAVSGMPSGTVNARVFSVLNSTTESDPVTVTAAFV